MTPPTLPRDVFSESSDESIVDRSRLIASNVWNSWIMLFIAAASVMSYHMLFQLTKPSPVSNAPASDVFSVAAYSVVIAALVASLGLPVALLLDQVTARLFGPGKTGSGVLFTAGLTYAVGYLAFLENLIYTATKAGLKTQDNTIVEAAFGVCALAFGVLTARIISNVTLRTTRAIGSVALLLLLPAGFLVTQEATAGTPGVPGSIPVSSPANVVILSSDGIDAEHMSVYGYGRETTPFLDSKKSEFRIFNNAFANAGNTTGSITSLLTGMSPFTTGVVYPPDALNEAHAFQSLPHMLHEAHYYTSNWALPHYADGLTQNLADAFDVDNGYAVGTSLLTDMPLGAGTARWFVVETIENTMGLVKDVLGIAPLDNDFMQVAAVDGQTLNDDERLEAVVADIGEHNRFFINTHFLGTHGPTFAIDHPHFTRNQRMTEPYQQDFYDDAIRDFDHQISTVYEELLRTGKLDNTILIVTSDHGMLGDPTMRVPLLFRFPSRAVTGRSSINVQRTDVAPTVLDVLGIAVPPWMDGLSILDTSDVPVDRTIYVARVEEWVRAGNLGWRSSDDLTVTAIRCRRFVKVLASGEVQHGRVIGSDAECDLNPATPESQRVTSAMISGAG